MKHSRKPRVSKNSKAVMCLKRTGKLEKFGSCMVSTVPGHVYVSVSSPLTQYIRNSQTAVLMI